MAPGKEESVRDIIISIHTEHVEKIVRREKNHEFRSYLLPASTTRLWIYETRPLSSIRYVATIGPAKRPGEIQDPAGLKNDLFDRGEMQSGAGYAYEILKLEELPQTYSLDDLKRNGWLKGPPQKYCFVKPSMQQALVTLPLQVVFDASRPMSLQSNDEWGKEDEDVGTIGSH